MNATRRACVVIFVASAFTIGGSLSVSPLCAQAPTIASLAPLGVQPGQATDIVIRGGNLVGATELWTNFPSKSVLTPNKPNNGKNAGEVSFRLTVPAET